jgi:hypothetical protein
MSIYFSRKGDASLSIVKSLFRYLGYGDENCLKTQLDVLVLLDRGYNIASVIRFLLNLKCQLLGTHSEKAGKWPYCTTGNPKEWQVSVSVEGARTVLFSTRKVNSLMQKEDVKNFQEAIPNIDYRCQVVHESVTCNTQLACYAVATTAVEFCLIVIVPSSITHAYKSFTNLVRNDYLHWLFKPGGNEFDKTLSAMPRYKQGDIKWGYAKDDETVRCRLLVMMGLYDLRKESGRPLPPSDGQWR